MILVDSSVWIAFFRKRPGPEVAELRRLIRDERQSLAICEPIAMELLAGVGAPQVASVEKLVDGLISLDVESATHFRHAAAIYRAVRLSGHTVRALNDCLIGAIAITHEASILHSDQDFERIAACTSLLIHRAA